jgi:hypothetical protein
MYNIFKFYMLLKYVYIYIYIRLLSLEAQYNILCFNFGNFRYNSSLATEL